MFLAHKRISEGSYDTEDRSNDAENLTNSKLLNGCVYQCLFITKLTISNVINILNNSVGMRLLHNDQIFLLSFQLVCTDICNVYMHPFEII